MLVWRLTFLTSILAAVLAAGGCSSNKAPSAGKSPHAGTPDANLDPCAIHMQDDICPALLMYYARNHRFPSLLEEMQQIPGYQNLQFNCPQSGKRYGYSAQGLALPDGRARVLLYDTEPVHSGLRWGIEMVPPEQGSLPYLTVVPIPEKEFQSIQAQ